MVSTGRRAGAAPPLGPAGPQRARRDEVARRRREQQRERPADEECPPEALVGALPALERAPDYDGARARAEGYRDDARALRDRADAPMVLVQAAGHRGRGLSRRQQ